MAIDPASPTEGAAPPFPLFGPGQQAPEAAIALQKEVLDACQKTSDEFFRSVQIDPKMTMPHELVEQYLSSLLVA